MHRPLDAFPFVFTSSMALAISAGTLSAGVQTFADRAAFESGVTVEHREDFEGFFAPGTTFGGANLGPTSGAVFLPIVYSASPGGFAHLITQEFHTGDSAAGAAFEADVSARIDLGGAFHAFGLDLLAWNGSTGAVMYEVALLSGGVVLGDPMLVPANGFFGVTSEIPFDAVLLSGINAQADGIAREVFDDLVLADAQGVCSGDCDGSGAVNFADLVSMLFVFGTDTIACDADGSGVVNFADLVSALFAFGPCE